MLPILVGILYKGVSSNLPPLSACFIPVTSGVHGGYMSLAKCLSSQHHTPRVALSLGWMHHPQSKSRRIFSGAAYQGREHCPHPSSCDFAQAQVCLPRGWMESYSTSLSPGWTALSGPSAQLPGPLSCPWGHALLPLAVRWLLETPCMCRRIHGSF